MPMRWRIEIDKDSCQGSGVCVGLAPDYFELGPDQKSRPRQATVDESVSSVAECCPSEAIILIAEEVR
jgi:ferredoxin